MPDNCAVFFFIEPDDEEFKHTMKNARRKLEIPMLAALLCKTPVIAAVKPAAILGNARPNMLVLSKPTNLWVRLEGVPQRYHEDHIAAKGINSTSHYNLVHKFIPMPQALKSSDAKAAVEKEWEKLEKILAWQLTKVSKKKEVIDEARNEGRKVHFAWLMDLCHFKNSELEPQYQKYKGRIVLRGDIVKDDSGSYTVFTEQGSSASQMTAAKIMDIISRLPGCAGQAADALSACTQVKMEDAPT